MKNGIMFRCHPDLLNLLKDIQSERHDLKTDKSKKSLTAMSYLAFLILKETDNLEKILTRRVFL